MRFVGCAATSREIAAVFGGDDIVVRARGDLIDPGWRGDIRDAARLRGQYRPGRRQNRLNSR
jgi:hypothetical protein